MMSKEKKFKILPKGLMFLMATTMSQAAFADHEKPGEDFPPHVVNEHAGGGGAIIGPIEPPGVMEAADAATKGYFLNIKLHDSQPEMRVWFDKNSGRFNLIANTEPKFDDLVKERTNRERADFFFYEAMRCEDEKNFRLAARFYEECLRLYESENQPLFRRQFVRRYIDVLRKLGEVDNARKIEQDFQFGGPWTPMPPSFMVPVPIPQHR